VTTAGAVLRAFPGFLETPFGVDLTPED